MITILLFLILFVICWPVALLFLGIILAPIIIVVGFIIEFWWVLLIIVVIALGIIVKNTSIVVKPKTIHKAVCEVKKVAKNCVYCNELLNGEVIRCHMCGRERPFVPK